MIRLVVAGGIWAVMAGVALGEGAGAATGSATPERARALREIILLMEDEAAALRSEIHAMRA